MPESISINIDKQMLSSSDIKEDNNSIWDSYICVFSKVIDWSNSG
jgi:hypothetical protein